MPAKPLAALIVFVFALVVALTEVAVVIFQAVTAIGAADLLLRWGGAAVAVIAIIVAQRIHTQQLQATVAELGEDVKAIRKDVGKIERMIEVHEYRLNHLESVKKS